MNINHSSKTGISFGITSGIITTLGLIMGLHSGTGSISVVIGGVLTIAVADSFSDALGIHISEESENKHTTKEIWNSSFSTFLAKLTIALSFLLPLVILPTNLAIIACMIWGLSILAIFSYFLSKANNQSSWQVITEHLVVAAAVIFIAHYIGDLISRYIS